MNFRDLKQGNELFIMNRDTIEIKRGNVTNVTAPHVDAKINMPLQQVVDITVLIDGKSVTYVAQEGASVTYCGSLIISCNKEYILKRNQKRFWTKSMAMDDASTITADILNSEE